MEIIEVYVEKYFAPSNAGRGYSTVIESFGGLDKMQAKIKIEELEKQWYPKNTDTASFYIGSRIKK